MSNLTMISPRLDGCLAIGRPSPTKRFSVVGLMTSVNWSFFDRFESRVGTLIVVPQSA